MDSNFRSFVTASVLDIFRNNLDLARITSNKRTATLDSSRGYKNAIILCLKYVTLCSHFKEVTWSTVLPETQYVIEETQPVQLAVNNDDGEDDEAFFINDTQNMTPAK